MKLPLFMDGPLQNRLPSTKTALSVDSLSEICSRGKRAVAFGAQELSAQDLVRMPSVHESDGVLRQ